MGGEVVEDDNGARNQVRDKTFLTQAAKAGPGIARLFPHGAKIASARPAMNVRVQHDPNGASITGAPRMSGAIDRHVLTGKAIFSDDGPVNMLAPGAGRTQIGRLSVHACSESPWASSTPPAA